MRASIRRRSGVLQSPGSLLLSKGLSLGSCGQLHAVKQGLEDALDQPAFTVPLSHPQLTGYLNLPPATRFPFVSASQQITSTHTSTIWRNCFAAVHHASSPHEALARSASSTPHTPNEAGRRNRRRRAASLRRRDSRYVRTARCFRQLSGGPRRARRWHPAG